MSDNLITNHDAVGYDNLLAGGQANTTTGPVTLKSGAAYAAGTVVGIITATGKAVAVDSTAADGSQVPYGVLTEARDATAEEKAAVVYLTGEFNERKLIFGGTDTVATHKAKMREIGIFTRKTIKV